MEHTIKENLEGDLQLGLTVADMAEKYGRGKTTIKYWLNKYSLKPNSRCIQIKKRVCQHCEKEFELTLSQFLNHSRWCEHNPKRKEYVETNKSKALVAMKKKREETGLYNQFTKAKIEGTEIPDAWNKGKRCPQCSHQHTEESKKQISRARKKYLKENPNKHPWKNNDKFKSVPCEHFKGLLSERGIEFEPEFEPLKDRNFAVDIAFPDIKLIVEINGNQHYDSDKNLAPYYQERHDLIKEEGWEIIEAHYKLAYSEDFLNEITERVTNNNK